MRVTAILPSLLMTLAMPLVAQPVPSTPSPSAIGSNWQRVQALPPNTSLYISANKKTTSCALKSVAADTLTCTHGKDLVYQRTEITAVKLTHRGRSTLIATGVGAVTGAIIGFAIGTKPGGFFGPNAFRGAVAAIGGVAGAVIGAPVGYFTDLNRSTVYKTP